MISNIPTPNNDALFTALASRVDLLVIYCARTERNRAWALPADKGYPHKILPGLHFGTDLHLNPGVGKAIDDFDPSFVVLTGGYTMPTFRLAVRRLSKGDIPWLYWGEELGLLDRFGPIPGKRILRRALLRAYGVLAVGSRAIKSYERAGVASDRIVNFPYVADFATFASAAKLRSERDSIRAELGIDPGSFVFLFAGQLIRRKGVDVLLDAFAKIDDPSVCLVIAGDGPDQGQLQASAEKLGSLARFVGFVHGDRMPRLFAGADMFVLPSRKEGWGVVVGEALAAGLPVIVSDAVNAGADLIENGVNGFTFVSEDGGSLAATLKEAVAARSRLKEMSKAAVARAERESPVNAVQRFLCIRDRVAAAQDLIGC